MPNHWTYYRGTGPKVHVPRRSGADPATNNAEECNARPPQEGSYYPNGHQNLRKHQQKCPMGEEGTAVAQIQPLDETVRIQ